MSVFCLVLSIVVGLRKKSAIINLPLLPESLSKKTK